MKRVFLFLCALLTGASLFAAPGKLTVDHWKSILRYRNRNFMLSIPYRGATVSWTCGGIVVKEGRWKQSITFETKENADQRGAEVRCADGSVLSFQLNDDNTISARLSGVPGKGKSLFISGETSIVDAGKLLIGGDEFSLKSKGNKGGIKSITFFAGDEAKCITFKFTSARAFFSWDPSIKHGLLLEILPPAGSDAAEFIIIPGAE